MGSSASVRLARFGLAAVVVAATAVMAPTAAWAATPTLTATPNTNLADAQAITVTAAHYPANVSLDLAECDKTFGCDLTHLRVFFSGSSGGFKTTYFVSRILTLKGGKTVDCAKTGHCVLVSLDISKFSTGAETPITFDPNKPIVPPLSISMSLDGSDGVIVSSGVAVLHGNVTCNRSADVYLDTYMTQVHNGTISQSYGNSEVECDGAETVPWQMTVTPQTQYFVTGPAQVHVNAYGRASNSSSSASANGTVILSAANLPVLIPSSAHVAVPAPGSTVVLHYWVLLSAASQYPVSFSYSTLNGTASAPDDYVPASGYLTIPAGSTKGIIAITINGNSKSPGTRRFVVSVTNPLNAMLGNDNGRGTVSLVHS